jgi:hypothetical protein
MKRQEVGESCIMRSFITCTPLHHFGTVDKVKDSCTKALKDILEEAYRDAFDAWKFRSKRYIDTEGASFETF